MSRVIVITSGKGGVGKTTSSANLGMALAQLGKRLVLIDADFGLRNLDLLLGLENRIVYTAQDVLAGNCRLEQALVKDKRQPNLCLLPAANNRMKESVTPQQMEQLVALLDGQFDFILIDSPAGIEAGFQNAIAAAREAVIVTTPEIAAVRDADRVIGLLEAHGITDIRLILNRLRPAMVKANDMMSVEDVQEILAISLVGIIPDDEQVIISTNRGEPLVLAETPSMAAKAFTNVARRLSGESVDFLNLEEPQNGVLSKIRRILNKKIL